MDSFFANIVVSSLISMATWTDENTRIVCEIFADEVQKGNRAYTHLNKARYKNVIQRYTSNVGTSVMLNISCLDHLCF